jgi:DNA-binding response OmpR family regulator
MTAQNDIPEALRPSLILAHPDANYTATASRCFRRREWAVYVARDAAEVHLLDRLHAPELVVLDANLAGESGWLTCDKLRAERGNVKVVIVAEEPTQQLERFADFVGAARLVSVHSAPATLVDLVERVALV